MIKKEKKNKPHLSLNPDFYTQAVCNILRANIQGQKLVSPHLQYTTTCRRLDVQLNLTAAILRLTSNKKINAIAHKH